MALTKALIYSSTQKQIIPNSRNGFNSGAIAPDYFFSDSINDYMSVGWLYAVVYRIALGCSEVKWILENVSNPDKPSKVNTHPILSVLNQVNPFQTKEEFIALHFIYKSLLGKSFWVINPNKGGEPAEIVLPYPNKMWVIPDKAFPYIKGYIYGDSPTDSNAIPLNVNEVIFDKDPNPLNQYTGLGAAQTIGVNLQAERYSNKWNRNFFFNSARPDGIISFEYNLSDEQFEKLKLTWSEKYKGTDKAHQVALLEGGGKYTQIQNTVKDMDFGTLALRNRDIILGVFGMPQSVLGISENVNKANAEAGDYTYARHLIKPRLSWLCSKLNEQFLPKFKGTQNLKLSFEEVVPETVEEKKGLAESGIRSSILTIDEARKKIGEDPLGGAIGDCVVVPANMVLIDKEGKVIYQAVQNNPLGGEPTLPGVDNTNAPSLFGDEPSESEELEEAKTLKGGAGSGNYGHEGRPGEVGGSADSGGSLSARAQRAKASYNPATKAKQGIADKREQDIARAVKGKRTADNDPFDVLVGDNAIEVKTIVGGKNPKITMHKSSLARKNSWASSKWKIHTVVIEHGTGKVFYRSGVGSFRVSSMEQVDLNSLLSKFK